MFGQLNLSNTMEAKITDNVNYEKAYGASDVGTLHLSNYTLLGPDGTVYDGADPGNYTHTGLHHNAEYTEYQAPSVPEWEVLYYTILWMYITPTLFSLITLSGCVGNSLVIWIIISKKAMHTATNYLLLNLGKSYSDYLLLNLGTS